MAKELPLALAEAGHSRFMQVFVLSRETHQIDPAVLSAELTQESGTSCDLPFLFFDLSIPQVGNYRMAFRVAHLPFREVPRREYTLKDYTFRMPKCFQPRTWHMQLIKLIQNYSTKADYE